MKILKDYGLWYKKSEDKFIPDEYKYNSKKVRLSLLKGLMDSDEYLDSKNTYCISTTSEKLASDIRWLCWSLGYNTFITKQRAGYKADGVYKECLPVYVIIIHTYDVIATSIVLIVIGATLGVSLFVQSWVKAAIFVDGLVFIATGITFLMAPYNYVFILFGVILLVIAVLAYMKRLPNFLLCLFYKN
jgi:hypothetical protein